MDGWTVLAICVCVMLLTAVVVGTCVYVKMHHKVSFMIDALEDREVGFRYRENRWPLPGFNRLLNRLRHIFEREMQELTEQNLYYGRMLDNIRTGIFVVDTESRGRVIYHNQAALQILGMAPVNHLRQLSLVDKELQTAFENIPENKEMRCSFYNERNRITISMTASLATFDGKSVRIIAFNDITGDMEHSEEMSWNKLVRVLNHEIMNTITPIASLSDTFSRDLKEAAANGGRNLNLEELEHGFETIASSSKALITFVNNYRSLTRVAMPVKKAFYVRELIDRVMGLTDRMVRESGARISYTEESDDVILYADEGQMAQIVVNLIKNALQAGAHAIFISSRINSSEQVLISVSNDGRPISRESAEQIFVPFYTTKQDGSGIGLSLSRQMMRLHNGSIILERSDEQVTTFTLCFK